jgi:hypothetical protein
MAPQVEVVDAAVTLQLQVHLAGRTRTGMTTDRTGVAATYKQIK